MGGRKAGLQSGWYPWKDPALGRVEGVISDDDDIMGVISSVSMKREGGKMKKYISIKTRAERANSNRVCAM